MDETETSSLHLYLPMLFTNLSLCHVSCLNCLNQAYFLIKTFKSLEYCYYKVAVNQQVGHVYVFIRLTFVKT